MEHAVQCRDHGLSLWRTSFKDLLDTRQTCRDIDDRDASCVERAKSKLRTGLTDGLGRDDTDRLANLDIIAGGQVTAIAHGADTVFALARDRRTKAHAGDAKLLNGNCCFVADETVLGNQNDVFVDDDLDRQ